MIKITSGTYGYRNPATGRIEAKTVKSEPFSLTHDREEELVNAGVAEYIGTEDNAEDEYEDVVDLPLYSDKSTIAELKAIAEESGVKVDKKATKKQIIEALDEAFAEDEEDSEDVPDISAILPE